MKHEMVIVDDVTAEGLRVPLAVHSAQRHPPEIGAKFSQLGDVVGDLCNGKTL